MFNVGLVVLLVRPGAGPSDLVFTTIQEVVLEDFIQKFTAVIAVKSKEIKGHPALDFFKPDTHFRSTIPPECGQFGPAAVQVGQGEAVEVFPAAAAAMAYGVGFEVAGAIHFLGSALHGDEGFETMAGAACFTSPTPAFSGGAHGCGDALEGACAVAGEALFQLLKP